MKKVEPRETESETNQANRKNNGQNQNEEHWIKKPRHGEYMLRNLNVNRDQATTHQWLSSKSREGWFNFCGVISNLAHQNLPS